MAADEDEEALLRSVALQNAQSILVARQRAEEELVRAKDALELRTGELARSLAMMRATLESTTDGILVTDGGGRVTDFNQKYQEMWRLPQELMNSEDHQQLLDVCGRQFADRQQYLARIDDIYSASPSESYDLLELADGRVFERFSRIQIVDGRNVGRVWSFRDITASRRAEEELQKQSEWLRVTLSSIGDAVITTDAEGRVTFLNRVAEALTGWFTADAAGRPLPDVFQVVNEQTRRSVENPALRALRDGTVVGLANHTVLIARDGTERPVDDSAAPMRDGSGATIGAVLVFRDITERHRTEAERERLLQEVKAERERLRLALDAGQTGVWDWDIAAGRITWSDRVAEFYGMRPEEFDGTLDMLARHLHPEDADRVMEAVRASVEEDAPYLIECRIVQKGGAVRWIYTAATVIRDVAGRPVRMIGATTDVTDRKRAEEELREAGRRKDEFLALLAHELRNPLAPLRNGLQVMRLAGDDANAVAQARAMMERQLGHMVRLIDDLLDVSRISRHKMELRRARVALADVVDNAVETARPIIEEAGHKLCVSLPSEPVFLDADLTRLAQVLSNLLTNSAKYTKTGGHIWLTAERRGDEVVASVRDTGIGIPAEALHHIFDMFSQVDRSIERSTGGLGIGLALVKGLVEMHGGTVTAESDGLGKGSTFTVRLPVLGAGEGPMAATSPEDDRPSSVSKRRILVVDDNQDSARTMGGLLKLLGHEVHTAFDGMEAVEAAKQFGPEVILMDVGMPRLNGYEAARRIREQPWGRDVIIIALTGWGQEGDRVQSREAGCDDHLVKPVNFPDLEKLLAELEESMTRHSREV